MLRDAQNRYTYFLLAAAASAIAFGVTQTRTVPLVATQLPLGAAVLAWAASFYAGCMHLRYVQSTLYANHALLKVEAGTHRRVPDHPQHRQAAHEGISQAMELNNEAASRYGNWQFRLLNAGAVLYLVWHVLEMARRSAPAV